MSNYAPSSKALLTESVVAAVDLSAHVAVGPDGNVAAAAGPMLGLTQYSCKAGVRVPYTQAGLEGAIAGGVINGYNTALEVGANGKLVTQVAGVTVARLRQDAAAADDAIQVVIVSH